MKLLSITSSKIVVSPNSLMERGYSIQHKVRGILPGCRKETDLHVTGMTGYIWVKNLWSHSGEARIKAADWAELVKSSRVEPYQHGSTKVEITPEIEAAAYASALSITTCSDVTAKPAFANSRHLAIRFHMIADSISRKDSLNG